MTYMHSSWWDVFHIITVTDDKIHLAAVTAQPLYYHCYNFYCRQVSCRIIHHHVSFQSQPSWWILGLLRIVDLRIIAVTQSLFPTDSTFIVVEIIAVIICLFVFSPSFVSVIMVFIDRTKDHTQTKENKCARGH